MAKLVQVKMMRREYGHPEDREAFGAYWVAYARGKSFGQYHSIERAGGWMEFMVQNGFAAHPDSDIQPSGVMPTGTDVGWFTGHVEKIHEMIANHPRKGKSIWEPHK